MFEITAEKIREILDYNPETGELTWKSFRGGSAKAGTRAGRVHHLGHRTVFIARKTCLEHRIIFLWMTGDWPKHQIDHINQDKADNRWANLREATHGQNVTNRATRRRKHDLPRGVRPMRGKFGAQIKTGGCIKYLGTFLTPEEAHAAYLKAAREAFGEFLPKELQHDPDI